jgi:carbohydrate-selective porin OprB
MAVSIVAHHFPAATWGSTCTYPAQESAYVVLKSWPHRPGNSKGHWRGREKLRTAGQTGQADPGTSWLVFEGLEASADV